MNEQDALMDRESSVLIRGPSAVKKATGTTSLPISSLWPPLKSARYCKKQRNRNCKSRGITPSIMLMHESSINHHRVTSALNELSTCHGNSYNSSVFDYLSNSQDSKPFWSKKTCQDFWNEYLECDTNLSHDMLLLSLNSPLSDETCPKNCYTKITKSIRKLLKRTFTGAPTFSELENLVKTINNGTLNTFTFELSCGQVLNSSESSATIKLDTPFHRVWLHAICQYHGLSSQSKTVNDQRLVHIKTSTSTTKNTIIPKINLYNFLLDFVLI